MDKAQKSVPISLRMFSSLMGLNLIDSREKERKIDAFMNELRRGDFTHIDDFEDLVDDILNNVLEKIKEYAGQDEDTKINTIRTFVQDFFRYHIFEELDNDAVEEIKKDFQKDLEKLVSGIKQESRQEEKVLESRIPVHWIFRNYIRVGQDYGQKATHDITREIDLQEKEESLYNEIKELMGHLKEYTGNGSADDEQTKAKVKEKLLAFARLLMNEYQALFDVEVDVELHENDLVQDINMVMKKAHDHPQVMQRLESLKKKIKEHCQKHFKVAKERMQKAEEIREDFSHGGM